MNAFKYTKSFVLVVLLGMLTVPSISQQRPGMGQGQGPGRGQGWQWSEDNVKERVERLSQSLELSEDQHNKVLEFELETYKKNQVNMQKYRDDRVKMREIMTEQRELRDKKYKEILTETQYNTFKANQQERMRNRPDPQQRPTETERPDRGRGRN